MKKYIISVCSFFIATQLCASHTYHKQGVVKHADGKISPKVPVYPSMISNSPTGDSYIRTGTVSGYHIGTLKRTTRKKNRKGTFTISTIQKSVIEDDAQQPLEKNSIPGATKNLIGFVRNPHFSEKTANQTPKNVPLYEYTGTSDTKSAEKVAQPAAQKSSQPSTTQQNSKK